MNLLEKCLAELDPCWSYARMNFERHFSLIGQIGGYSAGAAAWLGLAKDFIGLVGITAGAILSVWALLDRIQKKKSETPKP